MKYKDIKIGQLVRYPAKQLAEEMALGKRRGWNTNPDFGIVLGILPGDCDDMDLREPVDVYWHSDGEKLEVEAKWLDLMSEVKQ